MFRAACLVLLAVCGALAADNPQGPFSHTKHAALKLKCTVCHQTAVTDDQATFPAVAQCKTCHTAMAARQIPLRRTVVLPDFVFFSHARHATAKVECASCHDDVYAKDLPAESLVFRMVKCVNCHRETKATVVCTKCHELGQ